MSTPFAPNVVFTNVRKHIEQYHSGYTLKPLDNGVALTRNGDIIGVASTPLGAHKALLVHTRALRVGDTNGVQTRRGVIHVDDNPAKKGSLQPIPNSLFPPEVKALPIKRRPPMGRSTVLQLPRRVFDAVLERSIIERRSMAEVVLFAISVGLPVESVWKRARALRNQRTGERRRLEIYVTREASELIQRVPWGSFSAMGVAALEYVWGEELS